MIWVGWMVGLAWGAPDGALDALVRQLSVRHPAPSCAELRAGDEADSDRLIRVAESVSVPPWVPVRAARCVAEAASTDLLALEASVRWIEDTDRPGLALVVVGALGGLDDPSRGVLLPHVESRAKLEPRFRRFAIDVLDTEETVSLRRSTERLRALDRGDP